LKALKQTGDPTVIKNQLHDFGFRGVSSYETSASNLSTSSASFCSLIDRFICLFRFKVGSCAHLTSFYGTDTISGCILAQNYYLVHGMPAFSIPASEHSSMVSWTREKERDAYENLLGMSMCSSFDIIIFFSMHVFAWLS
jgi:nicotinamide phosphoribosyltransferase